MRVSPPQAPLSASVSVPARYDLILGDNGVARRRIGHAIVGSVRNAARVLEPRALLDHSLQLARPSDLEFAAAVRLRSPHQLAHPRLSIERLPPPAHFEPATAVLVVRIIRRRRASAGRSRLLLGRRSSEVVTGGLTHAERFREVTQVKRLEVEQVLLGGRVGRVRPDVSLERFASERCRLRTAPRGRGASVSKLSGRTRRAREGSKAPGR